jgi:hypothetical protein
MLRILDQKKRQLWVAETSGSCLYVTTITEKNLAGAY